MSLRLGVVGVTAILVVAGLGTVGAAAATTTVTISGAAWRDGDRDGVLDPGESPLSGQTIYLTASNGSLAATSGTDSAGRYVFSQIPAGTYTVQYDASSWRPLKDAWTPTTTGSLYPRVSISALSDSTVNFGWRPIIRSTDEAAPTSSYTDASGLRVDSYNDAVPASSLRDLLVAGTLIGKEAATTRLRFDITPSSFTSTSVLGSAGSYRSYSATVSLSWNEWLDDPETLLFHEYGHAWSLYYAYLVQQDQSLSSYLQFRGLLGDPRIDTSHAWSRQELIAEDYRQLFGTSAAGTTPQENTEVPAAASVSGLRDFLSTTFTGSGSAPAASPTPTPTASPTTSPAPTTSPTASPAPTASKKAGGGRHR